MCLGLGVRGGGAVSQTGLVRQGWRLGVYRYRAALFLFLSEQRRREREL